VYFRLFSYLFVFHFEVALLIPPVPYFLLEFAFLDVLAVRVFAWAVLVGVSRFPVFLPMLVDVVVRMVAIAFLFFNV